MTLDYASWYPTPGRVMGVAARRASRGGRCAPPGPHMGASGATIPKP